ncbi:MAG: tRNA 2-thiouridine(34) synthase MnmA [Chloroflexota bacterium]
MSKQRVLVGMSGGVDSSVTAALLVEQGYDVVGVTLNVWPELEGIDEQDREDACCALGAVADARSVADLLGIRHFTLNLRDLFRERVIKDFVQQYQQGRTPNPCIRCNQFIKFDALLARGLILNSDLVATGHYARIEQDVSSDRWLLRKATDLSKDQSYVLYVMTQDRLARAMLPLGELSKEEVRDLARRFALPVAEKGESQDICFVPYRSYTEFIERYAPESINDGSIVDETGQEVGRHRGVAFHTVGQRRGLGIAVGEPRFVTKLDPVLNVVQVGPMEQLLRAECIADELNWVAISGIEKPTRVLAKLRYRATEAPATVYPAIDGRARIEFETPQRAVTPGQAIVFYWDDVVVGGGTIAE